MSLMSPGVTVKMQTAVRTPFPLAAPSGMYVGTGGVELEAPKIDPSRATRSIATIPTAAATALAAAATATAAPGPASANTDDGAELDYPSGVPRRRRKRPVRSRSIRVARASKREVERARLRLDSEPPPQRPLTRADCAEGPRPCPHVSCKHHLYLDVSPYTGTIKINFPDIEVWEMRVSCALDIADHGGMRLEDVGELMNVTRERARQIEIQALAKLELGERQVSLRDYFE